MAEEAAYFYHTLSKCNRARVLGSLPQGFKSIDELVNAYKNNGYFSNRQLVEILNEMLMNESVPKEHLLDHDARSVLKRCKERICNLRHDNVIDLDVLFAIIADYLWIVASIRCCPTDRDEGYLHLIEWPTKEIAEIKQYLEGMQNEIVSAKQDLNDMQEAQNLPILNQIFAGTIKNENVRYYANSENYSYYELKNRIAACQEFIRKKEILFYAFVASYVLRVSLR